MAPASGRHGAPTVVPKIDLSHISKPGDVMKAILAKKKEEEEEARHVRVPAKPAAPPVQPAKPVVHAAPAAPPVAAAAPARPEPRKIVPQPRQAPPIIAHTHSSSGHCQPSSVGRCRGKATGRRGYRCAPGGCGCATSGRAP